MIDQIPLLPFPKGVARVLMKGLYPAASVLAFAFPSIDKDLDEAGSKFEGREYIAGALLAFTVYFVAAILLLIFIMTSHYGKAPDFATRMLVFGNALLISLSIFGYIMLYPVWMAGRRKNEIERDLLFATRHLMIETSAGVPLFEAIVSLSESFEDDELSYTRATSDYGEVGREFGRIVLEVRSGKELSVSLEESANRSASKNFRKVVWQLANANKTGARIGPVLKDEVDYLASEQIIMIRSYGSQLGTLALFYMLGCIIAPTMGVVMLAIASSVLPSLPLNEFTFTVLLALLLVVQVFFVGLIKSRRPVVSL